MVLILIKIDKDECAVCEDCVDVCPEGAIEKKVYNIVIHPDKCDKCGECIDVCAVGAIYDDEE